MTAPSLMVLGTDAVLAAAPATPVQLAHACLAAGYAAAIPASWGDELIAAHVMREVRAADAPRLQCSCPHVENRLAANGASIAPLTIATVAPPVAAALYLRAAFAPREIRVTFAGACPAGSHESIDEWILPADLLAALIDRGIDARKQPTEYDAVIPPDRRRYYSEPGGLPYRRMLSEGRDAAALVELGGGDLIVEMAQQLLRPGRSLVDVAASHGCSCCGAAGLAGLEYARARVLEHEPPRAPSPVVDADIPVKLTAPSRMESSNEPALEPAIVVTTRRRSPPSVVSVAPGSPPQARADDGRQLPRAYVGKRRSSPRGIRLSSLVPAPVVAVAPDPPATTAATEPQVVEPTAPMVRRAAMWLLRLVRTLTS